MPERLLLLFVVFITITSVAPAPLTRPYLWFACELSGNELETLFSNTTMLEELRKVNGSVALALPDYSAARTFAVKQLNQHNIDVLAWMLLPQDEGYWINLNNAQYLQAQYDKLEAWVTTENLRFSGIGLDLEFDLREYDDLLHQNYSQLLEFMYYDDSMPRLLAAKANVSAAIASMRSSGYRVMSFVIPIILDERAVGSTLLQRFTGLLDIPQVDQQIPMLYSNLMPDGEGELWSYGSSIPAGAAIGVGSTGSAGTPIADHVLSWQQLLGDILTAAQWTDTVAVYSLEGSVSKGHLTQLTEVDWAHQHAPPRPEEDIIECDVARDVLRRVLKESCIIQPHTCNQ